MNNYINIENGRYHIERVFSNKTSISEIIERQVKAKKGSSNLLTNIYSVSYNSDGGSIVDKEVLN